MRLCISLLILLTLLIAQHAIPIANPASLCHHTPALLTVLHYLYSMSSEPTITPGAPDAVAQSPSSPAFSPTSPTFSPVTTPEATPTRGAPTAVPAAPLTKDVPATEAATTASSDATVKVSHEMKASPANMAALEGVAFEAKRPPNLAAPDAEAPIAVDVKDPTKRTAGDWKADPPTASSWVAQHGHQTPRQLSADALADLLYIMCKKWPKLLKILEAGFEATDANMSKVFKRMATAAKGLRYGYEFVGWQYLSDLLISRSAQHIYKGIRAEILRPANSPMSPFSTYVSNLNVYEADRMGTLRTLKCELDMAVTIYFNYYTVPRRPNQAWVAQHEVLGLLRQLRVSMSIENMLDSLPLARQEAEARYRHDSWYTIAHPIFGGAWTTQLSRVVPANIVSWWRDQYDQIQSPMSGLESPLPHPPSQPPVPPPSQPPVPPPSQPPVPPLSQPPMPLPMPASQLAVEPPHPFPQHDQRVALREEPGRGQMVPVRRPQGRVTAWQGDPAVAGDPNRILHDDDFVEHVLDDGTRYTTPSLRNQMRALAYDLKTGTFYTKPKGRAMRNSALVPVTVTRTFDGKVGFLVTRFNACFRGMSEHRLCPRGDQCDKYHESTVGTVVTAPPGRGGVPITLGEVTDIVARNISNLLDSTEIERQCEEHFTHHYTRAASGMSAHAAMMAKMKAKIKLPAPAQPAPAHAALLPPPVEAKGPVSTGHATKAPRRSAKSSRKRRYESSDSSGSSDEDTANSESSASEESQDRKKHKRKKHKKKRKKSKKSEKSKSGLSYKDLKDLMILLAAKEQEKKEEAALESARRSRSSSHQ